MFNFFSTEILIKGKIFVKYISLCFSDRKLFADVSQGSIITKADLSKSNCYEIE